MAPLPVERVPPGRSMLQYIDKSSLTATNNPRCSECIRALTLRSSRIPDLLLNLLILTSSRWAGAPGKAQGFDDLPRTIAVSLAEEPVVHGLDRQMAQGVWTNNSRQMPRRQSQILHFFIPPSKP
jgi:hypothetical protein